MTLDDLNLSNYPDKGTIPDETTVSIQLKMRTIRQLKAFMVEQHEKTKLETSFNNETKELAVEQKLIKHTLRLNKLADNVTIKEVSKDIKTFASKPGDIGVSAPPIDVGQYWSSDSTSDLYEITQVAASIFPGGATLIHLSKPNCPAIHYAMSDFLSKFSYVNTKVDASHADIKVGQKWGLINWAFPTPHTVVKIVPPRSKISQAYIVLSAPGGARQGVLKDRFLKAYKRFYQ